MAKRTTRRPPRRYIHPQESEPFGVPRLRPQGSDPQGFNPQGFSPQGFKGRRSTGKQTMPTDTNEPRMRVTVEHFLAGLAVWAVLMVVYAMF